MKKFCNILKEERERSGYSQQQLANILKVARSLISQWENGICEPSINDLCKLSVILNITTDELLGMDNLETQDMIRKSLDLN